MESSYIEIPEQELARFCRENHIAKLSLFGSVLREDFGPDSDVDVLVEFEEGHVPGFFGLARMEGELSGLFGGRKNEESTMWHKSFGFEEEQDLFLARTRRQFYAHEASRHSEESEESIRLEALRDKWSRRVEELEEVADREGFEAVAPGLRYTW